MQNFRITLPQSLTLYNLSIGLHVYSSACTNKLMFNYIPICWKSQLIRQTFGCWNLQQSSNIYPTRCNVTQFILSWNCSTCFGWYHNPSSGAHITVCTAPINQPTGCNDFSSLLITFIYSSTCFGRPHAHHQEPNNCSSSLWFYLRSVVTAVLLVVFGPAQPRPTALLSPRSEGKIRGCYCRC